MFPTEISIGPFTFEYDVDRHEVFVSVGEEMKSMLETVSEDDWLAFYTLAATPQAQGAPIR